MNSERRRKQAVEEIYKYFSYNIENVKFKSKDLAIINIKVSYPNVKNLLNKEYFWESMKKNFDSKINEDIDLHNEDMYNKTVREVLLTSVTETMSKLNKSDYLKDDFTLEAKKINNEWQIEMLEK